MSTIQAGIPLKDLNLRGIDTDTRLVLAEKEQSLLGWFLTNIHKLHNYEKLIFQVLMLKIVYLDLSLILF